MENNVNSKSSEINNPNIKPNIQEMSVKDVQAVKGVKDNSVSESYLLQVSIRRKAGLVGLPGADPAERVYKIGASLDVRTKGNLKGISDELEKRFMPEIVGISANAPEFKRAVDDYWSAISVIVPIDEVFLKEPDKGLVLKIKTTIKSTIIKEDINLAVTTEEKMKILNKGLLNNSVELSNDSINDWLLLNYCLKYSLVANNPEDIHKSPKIVFYIYAKENAVKAAKSFIELKSEAFKLYDSLSNDEKKIDAVLLMFNNNPTEYDTITDKLIEIDKLYTQNKDTYEKFISFAKDAKWEDKYLITMAARKGKLNNPANSTVYYYNQVMIGRTIDEAVASLNDGSTEMSQIKLTLQREINIK